ncbi:hypothetical protein SAMN05216593_108197 [Pseudomonas asturiensis]|uniref:Uncharacterized protein n=1 Tax=Pseudomonas asturiensis TaxID=1190415 RepID=A0A1M7P781_9PSED|nr:hypothetical protein SAMN05216593_108197 [Pseudomonas asturiensis]
MATLSGCDEKTGGAYPLWEDSLTSSAIGEAA